VKSHKINLLVTRAPQWPVRNRARSSLRSRALLIVAVTVPRELPAIADPEDE